MEQTFNEKKKMYYWEMLKRSQPDPLLKSPNRIYFEIDS